MIVRKKESILSSMLAKAQERPGRIVQIPEQIFAGGPGEGPGSAILLDISKSISDHKEILLKPPGIFCQILRKKKVSCLMVTRGRTTFLERAIRCFLDQTYSNRELVVVGPENRDTSEFLKAYNDERIRFVSIKCQDIKLGELRNISIEAAVGEYIMQWDDDDWYHPDRITVQMAGLRYTGADICILNRWTLAWPARDLYLISKRRMWEGSILAERTKMEKYQSNLALGEDTEMLNRMIQAGYRFCQMDNPWLYVYYVHNSNSYPSEHFQNNIFNTWTERLNPEQAAEIRMKFKEDSSMGPPQESRNFPEIS